MDGEKHQVPMGTKQQFHILPGSVSLFSPMFKAFFPGIGGTMHSLASLDWTAGKNTAGPKRCYTVYTVYASGEHLLQPARSNPIILLHQPALDKESGL